MNFSSIWLNVRWGATGVWLALFALALALTLGALWRPRSRRFHGVTRAVWAAAMLAFVGMWLAGAALEMLRRTWSAPLGPLLLAMAVFSLLVAGVLALVREWFVRPAPPRPLAWKFDARRMAWTLIVLCGIGWALGGLALWPFETTSFRRSEALPVNWREALPANWLLALGGAQLAGAAQLVRAPDGSVARRQSAPGDLVAAAFHAGFGVVRAVGGGRHRLRVRGVCAARLGHEKRNRARAAGCAAFGAFAAAFGFGRRFGVARRKQSVASWLVRQKLAWTPLWSGAFAAFVLWLLLMASGGRFALRLAVHENGGARALHLGTGVGALAALTVFGAAGVIFWSFWPLASLFFALLKWHDSPERPARRARRNVERAAAISTNGGSPEKC